MSLSNLKNDMIEMIELAGELGKYSQMQLHCSDMEDKRNYSYAMAEKIRAKISTLQERFFYLKGKWFE